MNRRLYRSATDKVIGGVAGGLAELLEIDPTIVRVIWALMALVTGGVFFILYIVMWIVVPLGPDVAAGQGGAAPVEGEAPVAGAAWASHRHRGSGSGGLVFGMILIGLGGYFLAKEYVPAVDFDRLWPIGLVIAGLALLLVALRRPSA